MFLVLFDVEVRWGPNFTDSLRAPSISATPLFARKAPGVLFGASHFIQQSMQLSVLPLRCPRCLSKSYDMLKLLIYNLTLYYKLAFIRYLTSRRDLYSYF